MKKKVFSALLFGALIAVPGSTFMSCSDYDDDIAGLNETTGVLQEQLNKQTTALDEAKAALESEIEASKKAASDAMSAAQAAKAAADQAKAAGDQAQEDANRALQAAAEAKADAALAAQAAAQAKAEAIAEAQAMIAEALNGIETGVSEEKLASEISKIATRIDAIDSQLSTLSGKIGKVEVTVNEHESAIKALELQMKAVEGYKALIDANKNAIDDLKGKMDGINKSIEAINKAIAGINDLATNASVSDLRKYVDDQLAAVAKSIKDLKAELLTVPTRELKSMVFKPDFYYQGIEAMSANTYQYRAKNYAKFGLNEKADADMKGDKATDVLNPSCYYVTPGLVATYNLNPTNADVKVDDLKRFKFVVYNKDFVRASASVITPNIYKVENKAGELTVTANFEHADYIQDINANGAVTVMALQYETDAAKVISDYAAVKAERWENLTLNNAKLAPASTHAHLYTTAQEAIDNEATVDIEYNGTLDLRTVVNTHRNRVGSTTADQRWDKDAASGTVEKDGFEYSFQLVGYFAGASKTSETAHLCLNEDGYTVRAQMPTADGKQAAYGAEQSRAEIGKKPLVRVLLTDVINNRVAAVGYIKLNIIEKVTPPEPTKPLIVELKDFTNAYTLKCGTPDVLNANVDWASTETKILQLLNITKSEFEAGWTLDGDVESIGTDTRIVAKQYTPKKNDPNTMVLLTPEFGTVVENITNNTAEEHTITLNWTVGNNDAYQVFKAATTKKVYVCYKKNGSDRKLYVSLSWTPSVIKAKPTASIDEATKSESQWFKKDTNVSSKHDGSVPFDDIHGNVVNPDNGPATCKNEFKFGVTSTFINPGVRLAGLDAAYNPLFQSFEYRFIVPDVKEVSGNDGNKYVISVSNDGSNMIATKKGTAYNEPIATINKTTGEITYLCNESSKAILNNSGHNELAAGQTFTGKVEIVALACDPVNAITLTDNKLNVKFLRPVNVVKHKASDVRDGEDGGSESKLDFEFTDWRDYSFNDHKNYYDFYGVSAITADLANATTNVGSSAFVKLPTWMKLQYIPSTVEDFKLGDFGKFNYKNNGNPTSRDFQIKVPIKVVHFWGTVNTEVVINVKKTAGQNSNRK